MNQQRFLLWDLPTRIFHWALAFCVAAAVVSGQVGGPWIVWHGRFGLAVVALLTFRLVWGIAGPSYARFAQFFPSPSRLRAYLHQQWHGAGHNPLGAVSVFALLGLLSVQVATGLFSNDDIAFVGPLFALISKELSNRLTALHELTGNLLIALLFLHIAAIAFYLRMRGKNLLKPMLTGYQDGAGEATRGGGWLVLLLALALAVLALYAASGAWQTASTPPAAPTAAPSW